MEEQNLTQQEEEDEQKQQQQESSFVTPGIFRRRKLARPVKPDEIINENNKENGENFQWSIDQIAKIRPVELFDDTDEHSLLPPEDWDPGAEFSRSQLANVDHFWTHNTLIAPSPEVLSTTAAVASALRSPNISSSSLSYHQLFNQQHLLFQSSSSILSPTDSGLSNSSKCSLSNNSTNFMASPMMMLTRSQMSEFIKAQNIGGADKKALSRMPTSEKDTNEQMIADGSADFELLERSFSFEVADCIAADMDDDGGGFVFMEMRKEGPSVEPIEEGGLLLH